MKILIIDKIEPRLKKLLSDQYYTELNLTDNPEKIAQQAKNFNGIVMRSRFKIDIKFINKINNSKLKFIARVGTGLDHICVEYAEKKGIKIINSAEGNSRAVVEHTIGIIFNLTKNIAKADRQIRLNNQWLREQNRGFEIQGKTIAIIGYGNVGSLLAKCLSGFDCKVIAQDIKAIYADKFCHPVSIEQIFKNADIVTIHTPLTKITYQMCDTNFFNKFTKPIYFINTARGPIVKTKDLLKAMDEKKVIAAGLDVLEYEQQSFEHVTNNQDLNKLRQQENIILTPHIAGLTHQANKKMTDIIFKKIQSL